MRRHPRNARTRLTNDGMDYDNRMKIDDKYGMITEAKQSIRKFSIINGSVCLTILFLNLLIYKFNVVRLFNDITLAGIGHVINSWLILTSCVVSYIVTKMRNNNTFVIIAATICFVTIISFVLVIVFWAIDLENMEWYQGLFLILFLGNIIPHILLVLNVTELSSALEMQRMR
mmetsp:Transcript_105202/g.128442  ORF Transcript_105202/g.128442 Transcript_105202/m.128442 type:complete len:173 (-) Transcript_105202:125-643(-)